APGRAGEPAWPGSLAHGSIAPADGPGGNEPLLAAALRPGHRQDLGRLRRPGRMAHARRTARLAGGRVPRERLERQTHDEADGDVRDVSAKLGDLAGCPQAR